MTKELVIVESPAKARTVGHFLGSKYQVKASLGHIRDLPEKELGVDVSNNFAPKYIILKGKKRVIQEIKEAAKDALAIYLATDPDREGEAISWHLVQAAKLDKVPLKRVIFHEITQEALKEAFRHPRDIDLKLVNAQQARRILDRLVGYKISPILWRKIKRGLSAGRVQSVALAMIVEREREIESFTPKEYWSIEAELEKREGGSFRAELVGLINGEKLEIESEGEAKEISARLEKASFVVYQVQRRRVAHRPAPPFITSTLQQEAWRKFHFSAKRTMTLAQELYEGLPIGEEGTTGLITYMRTDSTRVSPQALAEARTYIAEKYGTEFIPPSPHTFTKKVRGAQEAHEAIRPTSIKREPSLLKPYLNIDQLKLYELIWKRMVSSQMATALTDEVTVKIEAKSQDLGNGYLLRATSSSLIFPGFLILYSEGKDEDEDGGEKLPLPELTKGEELELLRIFPSQHFTKPPPRYTEATLIKALEKEGIGRPSTYAPILSALGERGYVEKDKGHFKPKELGTIVADLLKEHFPTIVDKGFTAQMEEKLDKIAQGEQEWISMLREFYEPFEKTVEIAISSIPKIKVKGEPTNKLCESCRRPMVIKEGHSGRFLSCSGFPECKNAKPLPIDISCPECGGELVERQSKKGRLFYGCANFPNCEFSIWERPLPHPCPKCGGILTMAGKREAKCSKCGHKEIGKLLRIES